MTSPKRGWSLIFFIVPNLEYTIRIVMEKRKNQGAQNNNHYQRSGDKQLITFFFRRKQNELFSISVTYTFVLIFG